MSRFVTVPHLHTRDEVYAALVTAADAIEAVLHGTAPADAYNLPTKAKLALHEARALIDVAKFAVLAEDA